MKTNDFREIQVSSSLLVVIFLGVLALGVFIFLLGVSVGKKQVRVTAENRTVAQQVQELPRDPTAVKPGPSAADAAKTPASAEPGTKAAPDSSLAGGTTPSETSPPPKTASEAPAVKAPAKEEPKAAAKPPATATGPGLFYVQVAAFDEKPMALAEADKYKKRGYPAVVKDPKAGERPPKFRVRLGSYPTRDKATQVLNKLNEEAKKKTGFFIAKE
jgi:cell division septation protein DedD